MGSWGTVLAVTSAPPVTFLPKAVGIVCYTEYVGVGATTITATATGSPRHPPLGPVGSGLDVLVHANTAKGPFNSDDYFFMAD